MPTYSFSCPLEGCGAVLTSSETSMTDAAGDLAAKAVDHLAQVHPDIHKTPEEVMEDIKTHMVVAGE